MSLQNTYFGHEAIGDLLAGRRRLWFIGIAGVQMASLARAAKIRGFTVGGSDLRESAEVRELRRLGIPVRIGQRAEHLRGYDAVIYTLAISPENPEYKEALEKGIPLLSRADFLDYLCADFSNRVGVAGSHGKSTVCAMLASIFTQAGRSPTVFCGAKMTQFSSAALFGRGQDCIFEACEYGDSFLALSPTTVLLLNLDFDHADYFADRNAVAKSFAAFAARAGTLGNVVYNAEDKALAESLQKAPGRALGFGLHTGDCQAKDLRYTEGRGVFSLDIAGKDCGEVRLAVPGEHNVKNALAAALVAALCGVEEGAIRKGLSAFPGVGRRLSPRGSFHGARVLDDYAHHPTEIEASITTARAMAPKGRIFVVFQPHTYSRTAALFRPLCDALRSADRIFLTDIYPAREQDTLGMHARQLAERIGEHAAFFESAAAVKQALAEQLCPGDTVVLMGAGDIDRIFADFCAKDFTE